MYFDRDTIRVLKYIRKCGKNGAEWSDILKKFEYANQGMLLTFNSDLYACAYRQNGDPVPFETMKVKEVKGIRSYCTPKGNQRRKIIQLLEMDHSHIYFSHIFTYQHDYFLVYALRK